MDLRSEEPSSYRVEVSGWDARENFFVEKTILAWEQCGKKEIALQAGLRAGCVVFVRLLQTIASGSNFPIAYQVMEIAEKDRNGRSRVRLEQLRPREATKERSTAKEAVVQVANERKAGSKTGVTPWVSHF